MSSISFFLCKDVLKTKWDTYIVLPMLKLKSCLRLCCNELFYWPPLLVLQKCFKAHLFVFIAKFEDFHFLLDLLCIFVTDEHLTWGETCISSSAHWGRYKMADIFRWHLQMPFLLGKVMLSKRNLSEIPIKYKSYFSRKCISEWHLPRGYMYFGLHCFVMYQGRVTHMCVSKLGHHFFRLVAGSAQPLSGTLPD